MKNLEINDQIFPLTLNGLEQFSVEIGIPVKAEQKGKNIVVSVGDKIKIINESEFGENKSVRRRKIFHLMNQVFSIRVGDMAKSGTIEEKMNGVIRFNLRRSFINVLMDIFEGVPLEFSLDNVAEEINLLNDLDKSYSFLEWIKNNHSDCLVKGINMAMYDSIYDIDPLNLGKDAGIVADFAYKNCVYKVLQDPSSLWGEQ